MSNYRRWNFESGPDGEVQRCVDAHEKGQPCEYQQLTLGEAEGMQNEITRLQSEVERLRGRVAEQQSALESICECCWGGHEVMDVGQAATWMQFTAEKAIDDVPKTRAWLLRKQAEAIQDWLHGDAEMGGLDDYAQRLRQQADKLEQNQ